MFEFQMVVYILLFHQCHLFLLFLLFRLLHQRYQEWLTFHLRL
jgi:hypothetical protein